MTIKILLSPETETKLREQAAAAGKDLETFVRDAVEDIAGGGDASSEGSSSAAKWSEEWHAWAMSHRKLDYTVDDSRESIYAGRGE